MKLAEVIIQDTRANQPAASSVPIGTLYGVTDEGNIIERSDGTAWQDYSPTIAASGLDQLTGDVTAGPGTGSQVATIANDAIITAKILNDAITTAKILNAAITYAKMQDVSAISKLLGRGASGGAGDVEEITLGTNLTMSGTTLNAAGGGGGGGGLVLLGTQTASASATLDFTSLITSTYDVYEFQFYNLLPSTDASVQVQLSEDNGSSWIAGTTYKYAIFRINQLGTETQSVSNGISQWFVGGGESTAGRMGVSGSMKLFNPLSATQRKGATFQSIMDGADGNQENLIGSLFYDSTNAVNAIRFKFNTGNIASGSIRMYGYSKT